MAKLIQSLKSRFSPDTMAAQAMTVHALGDAELAARGIKRTDIAREIMTNGTWA